VSRDSVDRRRAEERTAAADADNDASTGDCGVALDRLRTTWETLGRDDPLWAVLSDPTRRGGRWDLGEFLDTGREHGELIERMVRGAGLSLGERVLDFGCGVGRLSNALAELGPRVVGVDIAASMVEHARRLARYPDQISFIHYDGRTLPFPDDAFDSAVSLMVLQHARPVGQLGCLLELQRVLRPGGVLLLQIPSRPRRPQPLHPTAYRARIEVLDAPPAARPGQETTLRVRVTNDSGHTWPADQRVNVGNHWWAGEEMIARDDGRAALPEPVPPGQSVELDLPVTVPDVDGAVELEVDLVQEFITWWAEVGSATARTAITVTTAVPESSRPEAGETAATADPAADPAGSAAGEMEMHGLDTDLVRSLFTHCGCRVMAAEPDHLAGPDWESYTYLVQV
jgi:SAM-dependent methyltransferase